jgi:peptidoglycan/xylan/chitin deacetylase (PgdA/CDA1 family)
VTLGASDDAAFRWPGGAGLAVSVVLNLEEGAERTFAEDGRGEGRSELTPPDTLTGRDLATESFYEYGIRAGVPRLVSVLDEAGVPATVFACGRAVERHPEAARLLSSRGYEFAGHGYRWIAPAEFTEDEEREEIRRTVEAIERATGRRPVGWYCRYGPSERTRGLLVEEGGFRYDSDSYADDLPYYETVGATQFTVVPYGLDVNDIKFWVAPSYGGVDDFEAALHRTFDRLLHESRQRAQLMSVGLHFRIVGRPARAAVLASFLRHAGAHKGVWFATRADIAEWWRRHHPPPPPEALASPQRAVPTRAADPDLEIPL